MHQKKRMNPLVCLVRTMWQHAEGNKKLILLYGTMSVLSMLVWLSIPLVMAKLINTVQERSEDTLLEQSGLLLAITVLLGVVGWMLHGPSRVLETLVAFSIKRTFQTRLIEKITRLPVRWQQAHHSGKTIDQVAKATAALGEFCECGFEILRLLGQFVAAVILLIWFMPSAGLVILVSAVVVVIAIVMFDRVLTEYYETSLKRFNEVASAVQDYLTNIKTVISLRLEERVVREVVERTERIRPIVRQTTITNETKWFVTSLVVDITRALTLFGFIFIACWKRQTIEIGTLFALIEYLRTLGESFYQFTWKYGDLLMKATKVEAVEHINKAFRAEVGETMKAVLPVGWQKLEIQNLTFRHPEQKLRALAIDNVELTLNRGKAYAFVGESGSGKSTLLALLRGLERADGGDVYCDGRREPNGLSAIAHHTALIPQDPEIFADSILFNITLGIEANKAAIDEAIRMSRFKHVLDRLERGLQSSIAEKGVSLSGGEKQRLALARGLFFAEDHDSEIILLDESTSSVDLVNERLIYEMILKHFRSRVVISAIHKFNLLPLFDEIVVVEHGKVVEHGTLNNLLAQRGTLSRMWERYSSDNHKKVAM